MLKKAGVHMIQVAQANHTGKEEFNTFIKPGEGEKKVVIVGAGIAGLEAAHVAALRGYEVNIYEKEAIVGGQINIAAVPPRKDELLRCIEYYNAVLPALGVKIHLNTEATKEIMNAADAVIVAMGAHDLALPIPDADGANVVSSWNALANKAARQGPLRRYRRRSSGYRDWRVSAGAGLHRFHHRDDG